MEKENDVVGGLVIKMWGCCPHASLAEKTNIMGEYAHLWDWVSRLIQIFLFRKSSWRIWWGVMSWL